MITKLNFDNLSPFRKMGNKVGNSGSKTQREVDSENRNTVLKSARGLPDGRQFQGYNVQNILNSSARINSMPSNITPKKARNAQQIQQLSSSQNQSQQQPQNYNNNSEFIQSNQYCKTQENTSPQSSQIQNTQQTQQSQQSFSKYSPMVIRQSLQKEKNQSNSSHSQSTLFTHQNLNQSISGGVNTSFNNLNNSHQVLNNLTNNTNNMSIVNNNTNSGNNNNSTTISNNVQNQQQYNQQEKITQDEIKRLKSEIESFKSREIKHLVKIASMEKENKRIQELQAKLEYENKMLKNELNNFSKHKRSNTALSGKRNDESGYNNTNNSNNNIQQTQGLYHNNIQLSQHNLQQGQQYPQQFQQQTIQKLDKGVQVQTTTKNEQQIAILEEYTRLLRKKLKDIEQNQKSQNNPMLIIGNNNTNINDSSIEMINIKNNYDFLKQKYKEVLERLYYIQKEGYEMKMESGFLKKFLKEKYSSFHSRSTTQTFDTNKNGLISQSSYKLLASSNNNKYISQSEADIAPSVVRALNLPSIIK